MKACLLSYSQCTVLPRVENERIKKHKLSIIPILNPPLRVTIRVHDGVGHQIQSDGALERGRRHTKSLHGMENTRKKRNILVPK